MAASKQQSAVEASPAPVATPPPPSWYYGVGFDQYNGDIIRFCDEDDDDKTSATRIVNGRWAVFPDASSIARGRLTISSHRKGETTRLQTGVYSVEAGRLTEVTTDDFGTVN